MNDTILSEDGTYKTVEHNESSVFFCMRSPVTIQLNNFIEKRHLSTMSDSSNVSIDDDVSNPLELTNIVVFPSKLQFFFSLV